MLFDYDTRYQFYNNPEYYALTSEGFSKERVGKLKQMRRDIFLNKYPQALDVIKQLSNEELVDETLNLAGGDDYDGCFTDLGCELLDLLREELLSRLEGEGT